MKVDFEAYKNEMKQLSTETIKFELERLKPQTDEISKSKKYRLINILRERGEI